MTVKDIKISFSFGFFALWAWLLYIYGNSATASLTLLSCLIHEAAHIIMMKLMGIKITSLRFGCGGIRLRSGRPLEMYGRKAYSVLMAGIAANIGVFILFFPLHRTFALINLALALFNLMPFTSLDGGQLLMILLEKRFILTGEIMRITDIIGGTAAALIFFTKGNVNFTLPLTLAVVILEGLGEMPQKAHSALSYRK